MAAADPVRDAALQGAVDALAAGEPAAALAACRALLDDPAAATWPGRAEALHQMALAQAGLGATEEALASLQAALALQADMAAGWRHLAALLEGLGRRGEAIAACRQALALVPREPVALRRLGGLLLAEGQGAEAVPVFRHALAMAPEDAGLRFGMGQALLAAGRADAAVSSLLRARTLQPGLPGSTLVLGQALAARGDWADAVGVLRAALAERPGDAATAVALGRALLALGRLEDAAATLRRALAQTPGDAGLLALLARVVLAQLRPAAALSLLRPALAARPAPVAAQLVAGQALLALGRPAEAAARLAGVVARQPEDDESRHALALARLTQGDYAAGWGDFALRWHGAPAPMEARLRQPRWSGAEALAGRRILLYAERSLEDTLQFLRYVPAVAALGAQVLLRVPPGLQALVAAMPGLAGVRLLAADEAPGAFDLRCALADLPGAFATTLPTVPAAVPYLAAPAARLAAFRAALAPFWAPFWAGDAAALKLGVIWTPGAPAVPGLPAGGLGAAALGGLLAGLAAARPVRLHALGPATAAAGEAAVLERFDSLVDLRAACADAAGLAAALACMDLVVAVDGPALHLAGALGRPVFALLGEAADWRWLVRRADSPWYPTARLFRRQPGQGWEAPIAAVAAALAGL